MCNPYRIGEKIYLRPIDVPDDSETIAAWLNDPDVTRTLRRYLPHTPSGVEEYVRKFAGSDTDIPLAIVAKEGDRFVGLCSIHGVSHRHRNGSLGLTVGEKSGWGKGYGKEAMELLIRLGFHTLNLHRLSLQVYSFNERAIRLYEKLGFRHEGRLRQDFFLDGVYHDTLNMGLLRDEWLAGQGGAG
jgi:RimJ/RimL family protein N-acetyltransferase